MKKRLLSIALALSLVAPVCASPTAEAIYAGTADVSSPNVFELGYNSSFAVSEDGSLWTWGVTEYGIQCLYTWVDDYDGEWLQQNGLTGKNMKPVKVMDGVVSVASSTGENTAIKKDGSLWMWGFSDYEEYTTEPVKIMSHVMSVNLGQRFYGAIKTDGSLWMWGDNSSYQLGTGDGEDRAKPVKIMDNVASVSLGREHSAAIKKDGSLWMWGDNDDCQLGTGGKKDDRSIPVKIMDNVAEVYAGDEFTAAIKTDGSLWMWGSGPIGTGDWLGRRIPTKIMDSVATVTFGEEGYYSNGQHSVAAIQKDGSLWVWGNNDGYQLGTGDGDHIYTPTKLMDNVTTVSLGAYHGAAIKKDGSLWTWGRNTYEGHTFGALGGGTMTGDNAPVKVLNDVAAVSVGEWITTAVKKDGTVWVCGMNINGWLGLGDTYKDYKYPTKEEPYLKYDEYEDVTIRPYLNKFAQIPGLKLSVDHLLPKCTITLNLNGGSGTTKVTCGEGGLLTPPNNPSRDGYFFAGWYKDKACKKPWNFDTDKVAGNCTLYAKWEPKSTTTVTAEPSTQKVEIDGKKIILNSYVLRNDQGYPVNFVKLRDIAYLLDGTEANFNVDWRNNAIRLDARQPYTTPNGAEMTVPTVMAAPAKTSITPVLTGGVTAPLEAFLLTDKNGGGHNYFKLRDIGKVAGFNVEWDGARGIIVVTTTEDYIG